MLSRRTVTGSPNTVQAENDTVIESLIAELAGDISAFGEFMAANATPIDARGDLDESTLVNDADDTLVSSLAAESLIAGSKRSATTAFPGSTSGSSDEGSPRSKRSADDSLPVFGNSNWQMVVRKQDGTWGVPTLLQGSEATLANEPVTAVRGKIY
jgi:hypothetical protein